MQDSHMQRHAAKKVNKKSRIKEPVVVTRSVKISRT